MHTSFRVLLTISLLLTAGAYAQSDSVQQRIILIGDAGEMHDGKIPVVDAVKRNINLQQGKNTVLFLGDNVYPLGLPDPAAGNRREKEQILDYQASLVKGTAAQGIFVPGNHDWSKHRPYGWRSIVQQQLYVDSMLQPNILFLPKEGCPGPEAVPLGNNVMLIVMDTEWWLYPGKKPGIESGCECKTEDEVLTAIADIAARNPGKLLVFAGHHPLRSHGPHGGYYTLKQHIFPLTDAKRWLYVPLPVIGSVYPLVRGVFGTREDLPHPLYRRMIRGIEAAIPADAPAVFVSGHDHTLQLIREGSRNFIVSGAGAKENQVKEGKNTLYATNLNGYTVLEVLNNGKVYAKIYGDQDAAPLYTSLLLDIAAYRRHEEAIAATPLPERVTVAADSQYIHANGFHRLMLGNNYRSVWATPLTFPVMRFDTLKILKRGGGQQTRSLRLEDPSGREWVLRSLKKDPLSAIPEPLRETFARQVVQDQISASNPYAPLVISPLAEAAGVPHTNPRFVYVANDTALHIYRKDFANGVYLFEEREPVTASKTYNTLKVLEELAGDNDNNVNQRAFLQARLLDIFIADWDRHEDQWRWYAEKDKKTKTFYPIPRDRDQAFFVNQGVIPRIADARYILPAVQGFRKKIPDVAAWNFNPRFLDRNMLNNLEDSTWERMSRNFAAIMTDSLIVTAVNQLQPAIRKQVDSMMISTLQARRSILHKEAMKYYRALARGVDITGSVKNEQFTITRQPNGFVNVTSEKISKKGELEQTLYSRTFNPAHTKEVALYGLGGEDRFVVRGNEKSPIRIRIIGGREKDTYIDSSGRTGGKRILIYDLAKGEDSFAVNRNERLRLSSDPAVIHYNRRAFQYNTLMPRIAGGYNLDDGILLGLGLEYKGHGFRKDSFAVKHTFSGMHAVATEAYQFKYQGQFNDVIGKADLILGALVRAPHNTANFFGFGNETAYNKEITDPAIRYYRARFNIYMGEVTLRNNFSPNISATVTPSITAVTLEPEHNAGRFLTNYDANKLDSAHLFANKYHAGLRLGVNFDTRDNDLVASRGLLWTTTLQGNTGLNAASNNYAQLRSDMSIYASTGLPPSVVFVVRVGGGVTWGKPEFFQALSLGGSTNLRGFRNNRFTGTSMLYNNLELRIKLFDFTSYILPGSVGLIAFNDVGRVWVKEETSGQWHNGFGGGLYLSPVNMFIVTATLGHSREGTLPYVTFGFKF
ncbi:BamA/TamA family outer membrane protein [Chitinophaga sp.]|uniref:BamA/TamA family outer membrane protein n=1 Tax=Chitinophaga sp. TaxID=1869181 RepID=UPI0031D04BF4